MLLCAILGDSLAAGVAMTRRDCMSDTQTGIASQAYAAAYTMRVSAATVLISLGVNDGPPTIGTVRHLTDLRAGVSGRHVYWLMPARPELTRSLIQALAAAHGDQVIETWGAAGPDGLHLSRKAYHAIGKMLDGAGP